MATNPHLAPRLKKEYSSGPSYHLTGWAWLTQLCTQSAGSFPDAGRRLPAINPPLFGRPSRSPPQYRLRRPISYHYNVGMSQLLFPGETDLKLKCHLYHLSGELRLIRLISFTGRAPNRAAQCLFQWAKALHSQHADKSLNAPSCRPGLGLCTALCTVVSSHHCRSEAGWP
jgi:hypothetical protein